MDLEERKVFDIMQQCQVNSNAEGDRFVGIKADTEKAIVYFPLGYDLPQEEGQIRKDIRNLFAVLSIFLKEERVIQDDKKDVAHYVDFPIHAYLNVIQYFLSYGYYIEKEITYKSGNSGRIDWNRTVKSKRGIISRDNLIYTDFIVRNETPNNNKLITQINKFCVEESFNRLGWLYIPTKPEKAGQHPSIKQSISILTDAKSDTNKDDTKILFQAMLDILKYLDDSTNDKKFFFGTDDFSHVWQNLVDRAFGVKNVSEYFPHGHWRTITNKGWRQSSALQEDSVMIFNGKYYVLDAKFYKYGNTGNAEKDLPPTDSIQKQITYAEYVKKTKKLEDGSLFNAFIMPFNKSNNVFGIDSVCGNIGEAVGDWKQNIAAYERVQGIVVDTRYLMFHYTDGDETLKSNLAKCIEEVSDHGTIPQFD